MMRVSTIILILGGISFLNIETVKLDRDTVNITPNTITTVFRRELVTARVEHIPRI
jgi:hypothetical protein